MAATQLMNRMQERLPNEHEQMDIVSKIVVKNVVVEAENTDAQQDGGQVKETEQEILNHGSELAKAGKAIELAELIKSSRPFLAKVSKAKAAKLVRTLVDLFLDMDAKTGIEVELCTECIQWAKDENRSFLRQALEARLIALYYDTGAYQEALKLEAVLLKELKRLDDKALLVEVQLLESKVYHALSNLPKSRAALTSSRTTANGIYCPPKLQAALDLQSGIIHAAEEKDFKTAYSYFYEAFENYDSIDNCKYAVMALKYMLLCKIMLNVAEEVQGIVSGKLALKYQGDDVDAMKSIAKASHNRSLADFHTSLKTYSTQLENDPIIQAHLKKLYDNLLEHNLCRIIEPFSKVQVVHVAELIRLGVDVVEKKLSQMILDKKFHGILDQGAGVLIIFDETPTDEMYSNALETIHSMGKVVDALYHKAKGLR